MDNGKIGYCRQECYQIQAICEIVGISRASFYRWRRVGWGLGSPVPKFLGSRDSEGYLSLVTRIKELKKAHPFWGFVGEANLRKAA